MTSKRDPVRVFIGTSAGGEDAEACLVCEYTLRARASRPVEVSWVALSRDPASPYYSDPRPHPAAAVDAEGLPRAQETLGWRTERWSTPWTALRWAVPAVCGWEGRVVYLDCPTVVLGDVVELADAPVPAGACVLVRRAGAQMHAGCLVFDCAAARGWVPDVAALQADVGAHQAMGAFLHRDGGLAGDLPAGWGLRDQDYSADPAAATGSVHCAVVRLQPHLPYARARLRRAGRAHWMDETPLPHYCQDLVALWRREYAAALAAGYEVEQYVPEELRAAQERRERA